MTPVRTIRKFRRNFNQTWFSVCSKHHPNNWNEQCGMCLRGSWRTDALVKPSRFLHRYFFWLWYRLVNLHWFKPKFVIYNKDENKSNDNAQ